MVNGQSATYSSSGSVGNNLLTMKSRSQYRKRSDEEMEEVTWLVDGKTLAEPQKVHLRSVCSVEEAIIHFKNLTNASIRVLWMDFTGNEVAYSVIEPNTSKRYKTYVTHPWIVREVSTGQRMMLGNRQVVYAFAGEQAVNINWPSTIKWQPSTHYLYPQPLREAVRGILMAHRHLENCPTDFDPELDTEAVQCQNLLQRSLCNILKLKLKARAVHHSQAAPVAPRPLEPVRAGPPPIHLGTLPEHLVFNIVQALAAVYEPCVFQDISMDRHLRPDIQPALMPCPPTESTSTP